AGDVGHGDALQAVGVDIESGPAFAQLLQSDSSFKSREPGTQAAVYAVPEGQRGGSASLDVEFVRMVVGAGVTRRGTGHQKGGRACGDRSAVEVDVAGG